MKAAGNLFSKKVGDAGNTAVVAAANTISALGGRKFFYGFYLLPAFVVVATIMKVDPITIQLTVGAMAGCIGVEGVADIKERASGAKGDSE